MPWLSMLITGRATGLGPGKNKRTTGNRITHKKAGIAQGYFKGIFMKKLIKNEKTVGDYALHSPRVGDLSKRIILWTPS